MIDERQWTIQMHNMKWDPNQIRSDRVPEELWTEVRDTVQEAIDQDNHVKCRAGWSTSKNRDCWEKYQYLRYADDTTLMAESEEELKSLLMKMREENEKVGFKCNIH